MLKKAIREESEVYGAVYFLALAFCLIQLVWDASWSWWLMQFFIIACVLCGWRMRRIFSYLRLANRIATLQSPHVFRNHQILNYLGLMLLCYAFVANLRSWPAVTFAVVVANIINFLHFMGFPERPVRTAATPDSLP